MSVRKLGASLAALIALSVPLAACGDSDDETTTEAQSYSISSISGDGAVPPGAVKHLIGNWGGELHQQGLDPFRVDVVIAHFDDSAPNHVHYTGINCSGNWTYLGLDDRTYRFREVINAGAGGNCKGVGIVRVTPSGEKLDYVFQGGGVESTGVLHRTTGPDSKAARN